MLCLLNLEEESTILVYIMSNNFRTVQYFKWYTTLLKKHLHEIHNNQNWSFCYSQAYGSVHVDLIKKLKHTGRFETWTVGRIGKTKPSNASILQTYSHLS